MGKIMKIIVVATRTEKATPEVMEPFLESETKKALSFVAEDFVREIYGRADGKGAVMVIEAADEGEVRRRLGELPFAQKGFLDLDVYPLVPYRGIVKAAAN